MIRHLNHQNYGRGQHGWLDSRFHFSFAEYWNPDNVQFGILRVLNDDIVQAGTGFDTHPHENMEIISYVVDGALTHTDSMGNKHTLTRGEVQYMSAGTGITHSEHNFGTEPLRFLQLWIFPDAKGYTPNYGDYRFAPEERKNKWLPMVSGDGDAAFPIQIHADVHIYAAEITKDETLSFEVAKDRQAYMVLIEGAASVNDTLMQMRDALEIVEEDLTISTPDTAHFLIIEMPKA